MATAELQSDLYTRSTQIWLTSSTGCYGPYRREGQHTAPSNEAFDQQLRSSNPDWGVRDLEAVTKAAASHGLVLQDVIAMPANNFCVVFRPGVGVP